ncbi:hypothetical protein G9A89_003120 [Geosiphon pyriformis]|nr:hypothetical protein G9A89_003120 [Geosiphon pyriformis]
MDTHAVYQLFNASYHPDRNIQKQAELQIKQIEGLPGFISALLQIVGSEISELGVRQAVAIYLKNRIRKAWRIDEDIPLSVAAPITDEDREVFKVSIIQILVTAPNAVRLQLLDSLNKVLTYDYPNHWPDFMNQIHSLLSSNDTRVVYVGLLCLHEVVKVYQWKSSELREPLIDIVKSTFPAILQIGQNLVNENSVDAAEMLKTLLKSYSSVIQYELILPLQDNSSLIPWGTLLLQIVAKPLADDSMPVDLEERESHPLWKAKKWSYRILNRLFGRYGNPAQLSGSPNQYLTFAENFIENFAPQILREYLHQTELWIQKKQWLSNKVLYFLSDFYKDAITHKITWQIFKSHSATIVSDFIFPQLCFSDQDQELWEEDPVEYVHKKVDPLEDFTSPAIVAITFLMDLAKYRKKYTFATTLSLINNILNTYLEAPPEAKNPRAKDGALRMIGCLSNLVLHKKSNVGHLMESFFTTHVFPEFRSEYPFLRARACDMLIKFSDLDFQKVNLGIAFQGITECMGDSELPVKVQAALALQSLIRHDIVKDALIPNLQVVMQELLNLTNQIDVDTLVTVMEEFVEVFSEELSPFAVQLCIQMRETFLRLMQDLEESHAHITKENYSSSGEMDEVSDKTMAATGVLKTISTLMLSLETTPETFAELEKALLPVITYTLENSIIDLYDEVFDIIDSCTFSTKNVSPIMWSVFEPIYKTFKDSGQDYIEEMLPALDNYISYGKDVFVQNHNLQGMIYDMIETVMKSDRLIENDRVCACKLIESVLLNCRGHVDKYIEPFLGLVFGYLGRIEEITSSEFKIYCIETVVNALFYNPMQTLRILEERGLTQGFFTIWFNNLEKFSRVHDKKLVIVALCSLLEIPLEQLPPTLQNGWPQMFDGILNTFKTLPKAEAARQQIKKFYEGIESDDDTGEESKEFDLSQDDGKNINKDEEDYDEVEEIDDDENVTDEDAEYLEFLAKEAAKYSPDSDLKDEDEDMEEEALFESPLDDIDVYIRFQEILLGLQQHNPNSYAHLTKNLNLEKSNFISTIFSIADEHRKAQQELINQANFED